MVVNAIPSAQVVTGSGINDQYDARMALLNALGLATADTSGYYDSAMQGGSGLKPTLAREQMNINAGNTRDNTAISRDTLNASIADAQRQYQLDVQRFGLEVAKQNYDQRLGEATTRLAQLGMLAQQRGPKDYLGYNYLLNNMDQPPGTTTNPFASGINQPYTPPPMQDIPQPAPTQQYNQTSTSGSSAPGVGGSGGTQVPAAPHAPSSALPQGAQPYKAPPPSSTGAAISGNPAADAQLAASSGWAGAPPDIMAEFNRISGNMNNAYQAQVQNTGGNPGYAGGGVAPGGTAIVGDSTSGKPTGNEEAVISPGPFEVLNHQDTKAAGLLGDQGGPPAPPQGADIAAQAGQALMALITEIVHGAMAGGDQADVPPHPDQPGAPPMDQGSAMAQAAPHAAQGGSFGGWGQQQGGVQLDPMENPGGMRPGMHPLQWMKQFMSRPGMGGGHMPSFGQMGGDVLSRYAASRPQPEAWPHAATGGSFAGTGLTGPTGPGNDPGGGMFNYQAHSNQDTLNAPFVQQTLGHQASPAWQQRGQALGPFGSQPFSYTNYMSMLPSAQQMLQGFIESPQQMGGLGGDWMDELERSRRAAATGMSFGPARYGG